MAEAPPYPLFLNLAQQPILIVGGGSVALRKAKGLRESAATVTVVSPTFAVDFDALADVERVQAAFAAAHMAAKPWRLVFAATNIREVNAQVHAHAAEAGILCCRCDQPEEGDFSGAAIQRPGLKEKSPSERDAGGLTLAVSTAGASPLLAARICREAAEAIDPILLQLITLVARWREHARRQVPDAAARRALLQELAGAEMERALRSGGESAAQHLFEHWLASARHGHSHPQAPRTDGHIRTTKNPTPSPAVEHAD